MSEILARVKALAAELSGYDEDEIIETHSFFELGFDSLILTQLATAFQKEFGVKILFRQLAESLSTPIAVAEHIAPLTTVKSAPSVTEAPATPPPAANQTIQPAAPPQPVKVEQLPSMALVKPAAPEGIQSIMAEQLDLMMQQIQLLQGLRSGTAVIPASATQALPAPTVTTAAIAAPAREVATQDNAEETLQRSTLPKRFSGEVGGEASRLQQSQRDHIERLTARYNAKTNGSKTRTQKYRPCLADPRTASGFNRLWKEMVYPIVIERSLGAHLWDIDGNRYIDLTNGYGPNFFGHNAPFVNEALRHQLEAGFELGPQTPLAGEAAELFCELTGHDRVSWVNTGSEAVQAAIRLSRTFTGRDKIVMFAGDYHGNFDEVLVRGVKSSKSRRTIPATPGIPKMSVENVIVLEYGSDEALDVIRQQANDIAAVLVEPIQSRRPEFQPREFIQALRTLTEENGIVFVFDEVITGFRTGPGGAQAYYGVKADLATYGKVIGGGMPIGVVAGRSELMDTFDGGLWRYGDDSFPTAGVTFFAGTFVRHPMAIAAAHASLKYLKAAGPSLQDGVKRRSDRLCSQLNAIVKERGVNIEIPNFGSQIYIRINEPNELAGLLYLHLRDRGVHVIEGAPSYLTAAHTDEDIDHIVSAFKDSILEMQYDNALPIPDAVALPAWKRELPLTPGQQEIWAASQTSDLASCAFNESDAFSITGPLDKDLFRDAVTETLGAHEAFRLHFDRDGNLQFVDRDAKFELVLIDISGKSTDDQQREIEAYCHREATTPFNLETGPMVRVALFQRGAENYHFVVYCHHIIYDGYSAEVLIREIAERYTAKHDNQAPALEISVPFSAYIHQTVGNRDDAAKKESHKHWLSVFGDGAPDPLELPTDRPRTQRRSYKGATAHRSLNPALLTSLKASAKSCGVSLYSLLLASFSALLSRLSTQETFVVGIPSAGQAAREMETIGYCVNLLPILVHAKFDQSFEELAKTTQKSVFSAFEHQDMTVSELVEALRVPRDPSRLPLVETIFNYSRYFSGISMADCTISAMENQRAAVLYDMFFNIIETSDSLVIDWDYSQDLFDESTIERWIDHYVELLRSVSDDARRQIGELSLVSEQQTATIIQAWRKGAAAV